jgi:hypothetical protein
MIEPWEILPSIGQSGFLRDARSLPAHYRCRYDAVN